TPLNYRYMPPEIDHALEVSEASVLLAHAERAADVAASRRAAQLPLGVIRYGDGDSAGPRFEDLVAAPSASNSNSNSAVERVPSSSSSSSSVGGPAPDAPAFIFFTSGSTGPAKGVTHTHATFGWVVACAMQALQFQAGDVLLPGSSMSHIGALMHV